MKVYNNKYNNKGIKKFNYKLAEKNKRHKEKFLKRAAWEKKQEQRVKKIRDYTLKIYRKKLYMYNANLKKQLKKAFFFKKKKFLSKSCIINKTFKKSLINKIFFHKVLTKTNYANSYFSKPLALKVALEHVHWLQSEMWKYKRFWILKKKFRNLRRKKRYKLFAANPNVEANPRIFAYTLISKEFLNAPKFVCSKPFILSKKIVKFTKYSF